jgi:hypothetical protein
MDFIHIILAYISLVFIPILYAETHYRFKYFFSWLKKPEPEIIADIPSRLHQGRSLPILIIIKDADLYPVTILNVMILCNSQLIDQTSLNRTITIPYEEIILRVNSELLLEGENQVIVNIKYRVNDKIKTCSNDNHRGTSHDALPVYISSYSLPRLSDCYFGDTHSHTFFTSDQVEFGASLQATAEMAKAIELDFFCATDHSYDLDDKSNNYLINDPELTKWNNLWQEVNAFNSNSTNFLIIPGEEVTLRNQRDKNVHCLIYNSRNFFPGSGDGAEKWLNNRSELSIDQLLNEVTDDTLVFAAHPSIRPPVLQKLFINRGYWHQADCHNKRLNGLQFVNDGSVKEVEHGKRFWIELLLQGFRLIGLAGNDAHGNFARFRQIGLPFFTMRENYHHLFGKWRTGVYNPLEMNNTNLLHALKAGNCFMTNGPALQFTALVEDKWLPMGGIYRNIAKLKIESKSTSEFSDIYRIVIYAAYIGDQREQILLEIENFTDKFHHIYELDFIPIPRGGYVRAEVITIDGFQAISNPIWFNI